MTVQNTGHQPLAGAEMALSGQGALRLPTRTGRLQRRLVDAVAVARVHPLGALAFAGVVLLFVTAVFADVLAPYDPLEVHTDYLLTPPSSTFLLGTDNFGRDIFSRVLKGSQVSMIVGLFSVLIGTGIGTAAGIVSGYAGRRTDLIMQRIMDAWDAFPSILLAMALVAALGTGLHNVIVAIAIVSFPSVNRVVRGSVLAEKETMYVESARAIGANPHWIMLRHLLPNVTAPVIVVATANLGSAILAEASLSFLGLGVPKPHPTWGGMLSGDGRSYMVAAPWIAIFPGLALTLAILCWNLLGDTMRDIWDPRLRGSK